MNEASRMGRRRFLRPPPRLGVAEFRARTAHRSQRSLGECARDSLVSSLSRFRDVFAVPPFATKLDDLHKDFSNLGIWTPKETEPEYLIHGSYLGNRRKINLILGLTNLNRKELVWSTRITIDRDELELIDQKIANECVAPIVLYLQRYEEDSWSWVQHSKEERLFRTAQALMSRRTLKTLHHARRLLVGIIKRCGDIGDVYVALARAEQSHGLLLAGERFVEALERGRIYAKKAIELDDLNARAYAELALQELFLKRYPEAAAAYRRALDLNPYDPLLWADWGECLALMGNALEALPILQQAATGWPRDKTWVEWNLCDAEWALGQPERIIEILADQPDLPHVHRYLAASYAKLGQMIKARRHADRVRHHQPNFSAREWARVVPWRDADIAEDYADCLAKAGL